VLTLEHLFMPKQSKTKAKTKAQSKTKRNAKPEAPGITTKKSYWVMLTVVMAVAVAVAGFIVKLSAEQIAFLTVTIAMAIALIGYVRLTPSTLSVSKRATFLFFGAAVIGFGVWTAIILSLYATGSIENIFSDQFFVFPSLIISLAGGAFIGELLGRNIRVQSFFFKQEDA